MVKLENICGQAGSCHIKGIHLEIPTGGHAVIMGRTGCGKTTLLEIICGLRRPTSGRILMDGRDVTGLPPKDRHIGYLPQDIALFPGLTVREQLAFPLRLKGIPRHRREQDIQPLAAELGLLPLLDRHVEKLSGGEKQRVALGRALAAEPALLLLDEPLSALDEEVKGGVASMIRESRRKHGFTVIHVTHSLPEARVFTDRIFRWKDEGLVSEPPAPSGA
jgi:ABC-type sugar transport system ATPase subunit